MKNVIFLKYVLFSLCWMIGFLQNVHSSHHRHSVLMLIIDDLRSSIIDPDTQENNLKLPSIDKLASRGVRFRSAFAQYAMCSPSRSSLLTGTRPDTTNVFDLVTHFRQNIPTVVTLPQAFRNEGYLCYGIGKVFHRGYGDDEFSFTTPQPPVDKHAYCLQSNVIIDKERKDTSHKEGIMHGGKVQRGPALEVSHSNCSFHDSTTADVAIQTLQQVAKGALLSAGKFKKNEQYDTTEKVSSGENDKGKPFFLAVGFIRPHLPWVAPIDFWNQHKESNFQHLHTSALSKRSEVNSKRLPSFVLQGGSHELASYYGIDLKALGGGGGGGSADGDANNQIYSAAQLRQGYAASASYSDFQVGRVLDELERLKLDEVTNVVLWSDHGYKLGEHGGAWGKNSNTDLDTRVPLIVALPKDYFPLSSKNEMFETTGWETNALVELVDVYPTLLDLCSIPLPKQSHPLEGSSFKLLLMNKTLAIKSLKKEGGTDKDQAMLSSNGSGGDDGDDIWKSAVFSQVARKHLLTGYSMTTPQYRYTVWIDTRSIYQDSKASKSPKQDHGIEITQAATQLEGNIMEEGSNTAPYPTSEIKLKQGETVEEEEEEEEKGKKNFDKVLVDEDLLKASERREKVLKNRLEKKMIKFVELYDHNLDPHEQVNLISSKDYSMLKQRLSSMWEKGFCGAVPLRAAYRFKKHNNVNREAEDYILPHIC